MSQINVVGTTLVDLDNWQHTGTHRFTGGQSFKIVDATDATKSVIFNLSSLPTGTETEFTIPDSDSSIVTLTATQTLTNKTLTTPTLNGGTWVATDSTFTIADNTTPTKIARFECSGLTAGTNVFTLPDTAADTIVTLAVAQTLTNKTLTSPVLGGTTTGTNIAITSTGDLDLIASGGTGDMTISAGRNTDITSAAGTITIRSSTGGDVQLDASGTGRDVILTAATAGGDVYVNGGLRLQRATTAVSASTSFRPILGVTDNSSARTVTLEQDVNSDGHIIIIKDEAGTAGSANNITISPESGTIDGGSSATINNNYGTWVGYGNGTNYFSLFSHTRAGQRYFIAAPGLAKVGATAGWVVAAAANTNKVTLPAGQTASTLVIPIAASLKVGWTITGFYLVGQIESAGNACTVDAVLTKSTAAAADVADAAIGAITQISVTADTEISAANSTKTLDTPEVIAANESFFCLITSTTAADTDVDLMGITIIVTEV